MRCALVRFSDRCQNAAGQNAQAIATASGHHDVAQYLAQIRIPVTERGQETHWFTQILHNAIDGQNVQRACIAINSGARMAAEDINRTPLLRTIAIPDEQRITALDQIAEALVKAGAPLSIMDDQDNTPLHKAATHGNSRLAKLFLERGASIDAQNNDGQTALDIALTTHRRPMVDLLIEYGARLTPEQQAANPWQHEGQPAAAH